MTKQACIDCQASPVSMVALHPPPSFETTLLAPQEKKQHYDKDYLQELQPPRTRPQNVSAVHQAQYYA